MIQRAGVKTVDCLQCSERLAILRELDESKLAQLGSPIKIEGWSLELWQTRTSTKRSKDGFQDVFVVTLEASRSFWGRIGLNIQTPCALVFSATSGEFLFYTTTRHRAYFLGIPLQIPKDVLPKKELRSQADKLLKDWKSGKK